MDRRLAIAISGSSAAIVLAVGLTAAGFAPGPRSGAQSESAPGEAGFIANEQVAQAAEARSAAENPEIVYVKPAAKPRTVVVKRPARAVPSASQTRARSDAPYQPRRVAGSAARRAHESESREHAREREAERRKEAWEHEREQEHERDDD